MFCHFIVTSVTVGVIAFAVAVVYGIITNKGWSSNCLLGGFAYHRVYMSQYILIKCAIHMESNPKKQPTRLISGSLIKLTRTFKTKT
jgi:hypothetical protein